MSKSGTKLVEMTASSLRWNWANDGHDYIVGQNNSAEKATYRKLIITMKWESSFANCRLYENTWSSKNMPVRYQEVVSSLCLQLLTDLFSGLAHFHKTWNWWYRAQASLPLPIIDRGWRTQALGIGTQICQYATDNAFPVFVGLKHGLIINNQ